MVGASAGGLQPIRLLLDGLDRSSGAAFLIVRHIHAEAVDILPQILQRDTRIEVFPAEAGTRLRAGAAYVARPDRHLLVDEQGALLLSRGPKENRSRPSVDVLFRSAAVHFRGDVLGVLLSGMLDDGAAGLAAIKSCGGLAVVQDPEDAEFPGMPRSGLAAAQVDRVAPAEYLPGVVNDLLAAPAPVGKPAPDSLAAEVRLAAGYVKGEELTRPLGDPADYSCPDCGGPLRTIDDGGPRRYRCLVGHAYSPLTLLEGQGQQTERAVWAAVRMLDERARMLTRLAAEARTLGRHRLADAHQEGAEEAGDHAQVLRDMLCLERARDRKPDLELV